MVVGLKGRPLTRDEERRITAQTSARSAGGRSSDAVRSYTTLNAIRTEEFILLFLLGALGGVTVTFIALSAL
jgi:hypothetical protein